ncbi:DUF4333 domain-containing protein [Mycolicibacillus parakoreensis]|uniref:DUF4333 domain-containing protein n=1 Tax=Mycolicibacillus parakoreensis TaxID=1069221 RepID=A0ABY3U6D2_9MYCO|nr:DUF4333 domain-containing protein [Mycolicibacillus parakoreensis]MCV7314014.1 DUF4333 domain-containing protein [Mycolicibacillus parakoreensis]ULN54121.1 DUF4333 domain-containing protein [Mycolicibacillus parakoreensis]HLS00011.1 DUF4333 domain-containing protein [Mycolicibacillus parakoreensis]
MSGPQDPDPANPWQPPTEQGDAASADGSQAAAPEGSGETSQWASPEQPAVEAQPPYPPTYPAIPGYPQPEQYGQPTPYVQPGQPGAYGQTTQYAQPGQYGQPIQYAQQPGPYGQTTQYPQPGPYGQPVPGVPPAQPGAAAPTGHHEHHLVADARTKFLGLPISGRAAVTLGVLTAAIVAAVLVVGFVWPGYFVTTKLDIEKAQNGVQQILGDETNGYGAKNVKDVICNEGKGDPTVKRGDSFDCEVSIDGTKRRVTVTFQDDAGTYEVSRPR